MNKVEVKQNDGDGRKIRLERWKISQKLKESQIASGQLATHPEAHFLRKFTWEGMLTIRFESDSYSADNPMAEARRDDLVGVFMDNLIRRKWRSRPRDVYWVAATEFGKSGAAHCHILFTFEGLELRGKTIPEISDLREDAVESLEFVCSLVGCPESSVDLDWQPNFDNSGLVDYFSKIESGRDYKHFLHSSYVSLYAWLIFEQRMNDMNAKLERILAKEKGELQ